MFEKEADEYATRECCTTCKNINHYCKEKCECWTFAKKGAEFGYNKANEWHYMKDELYTKCWKRYNKYLVIARFTTETGKSDVPLLAYFDHYQQKWYVDRTYLSAFNVIAWKEIVLPKESE